jgi:hypothetical protein
MLGRVHRNDLVVITGLSGKTGRPGPTIDQPESC